MEEDASRRIAELQCDMENLRAVIGLLILCNPHHRQLIDGLDALIARRMDQAPLSAVAVVCADRWREWMAEPKEESRKHGG